MNIAGIGIISMRGRGVAALEQALAQGWAPPGEVEVRGAAGGRMPAYAVSQETMTDKTVLAKARRADRFTRMAVLAAADALQEGERDGRLDRAKMGIIVATALGPHVTMFGFLDGILEFGDAGVSPTAFSHSVHNAAASYIAMTLDVRGPTLTLTHFHFAFHQAILLAESWLRESRCDSVLVGAVDELGPVMQYACSRMLKIAADGRIKPFAFSPAPEAVPGEGCAFFLLTREAAPAGYGRVAGVDFDGSHSTPPTGAFHLLDACGVTKDEAAYLAVLQPGVVAGGYAPLFGSTLTGSAFHAAVAALMLRNGKQYACPVPDNPRGIALCGETRPAPVRDVYCTRLDCAGRRATLRLTASHP